MKFFFLLPVIIFGISSFLKAKDIPNVKVIDSKSTESFQLKMLSNSGFERYIAVISSKHPNRRAMIIYDVDDKFPTMLAVDGTVLIYNVVGGNIMSIQAEPEAKANKLGDRVNFQVGIRQDFTDEKTKNIFEFDLGAIIRSNIDQGSGKLAFDDVKSEFKISSDLTSVTFTLGDSGFPQEFMLSTNQGRRPFLLKIDNIRVSTELPAWHRPINLENFSSRLRVISVRDEGKLSDDDHKMKKLMQGGASRIIRRSLIDKELEEALKNNSPIPLDFNKMREHDKAMREKWLEAVKEQGVLWDQVSEQGGTGQSATRPESKSEGSDKPQPEAEGRSR